MYTSVCVWCIDTTVVDNYMRVCAHCTCIQLGNSYVGGSQ